MISYEKLSAALERYRRRQRGELVEGLDEAQESENAIAFDVDDSAIIEAAEVSAAQPPAWPDEPAVARVASEDGTWQTSEIGAPPVNIEQNAEYGQDPFADDAAIQQDLESDLEGPLNSDPSLDGPTGEYAEQPMDQAYAEQPAAPQAPADVYAEQPMDQQDSLDELPPPTAEEEALVASPDKANLPPPPPQPGDKKTIFGMPVPQPPPEKVDDSPEADSGLVFVDDDEKDKN